MSLMLLIKSHEGKRRSYHISSKEIISIKNLVKVLKYQKAKNIIKMCIIRLKD